MDRQRALEILDAVRPHSTDLNDGEFSEAVAFLATNPEVEQEFIERQNFDKLIGQMMRDVSVPVNFNDQLQATLRDVPPADSVPERAQPKQHVAWWKRNLAITVCTIACCLVGFSLWFYQFTTKPQYQVHALQELAVVHFNDLDSLSSFSGDFSPTLPAFGWSSRQLRSSPDFRGLSVNSESRHAVALYRFRFDLGRRATAEGVLLVADRRSISLPPVQTHFSLGSIRYLQTNAGEFASVAWSDDSQVYVCIVRDAHTLERIKNALISTPA